MRLPAAPVSRSLFSLCSVLCCTFLTLLVVGPALAQQGSPEAAESAEVADEVSIQQQIEREEPPAAAPPKPKNMRELLDLVRQGFNLERAENKAREQAFLDAREDQARLVAEVEAKLARAEARSQGIEQQYNDKELELGQLQQRLSDRLGELGELFGMVRQVATDTSGQIWDSMTSSQLGGRKDLLDRLGRSTELPSTEDLEQLWYELQREMVEQGNVVRYKAKVLTADGELVERDVVRAGPFSAISQGKYLLWEPSEQQLRELTRQPPARYVNTVAPFERAEAGMVRLAVDPSRGSLLNALTDTPGLVERVQQGGYVGYVIIGLGFFALLLGAGRYAVVMTTGRRVAVQRTAEVPDTANPLGRVLAVYEQNRELDTETLELKLDEVVLRESSRLERSIWIVKAVSVVAPLLGLLGTVTGMIQTFQTITLFGAGDPKMMAGGISEALVTTMLGLIAAIPLVLLHSTLSNSARRIVEVLDEQSAGLIADRAEELHAGP
jgi:biopolymer transport protein ExbB